MPLVIENGSIVANANSFVTLAEIRAYAAARGVALSAVDAEIEALAVRAMDYITAQRTRYQGAKVSPSQPLQFPRIGVYIDNEEFPDTEIPTEVKNAQCQLCLEAASGVSLLPTVTGAQVKRERIENAIEIEYSEKNDDRSAPNMAAVDALLSPLFKASGYALSTVRV